MVGAGLPVPRSSTLALWLGLTTLAVIFLGFLIGGAISSKEALGLSLAVTVLAGLGWFFIPSPIHLRFIAFAALGLAIVLSLAALTTLPLAEEIRRTGLFAPVGGSSFSIAPGSTLVEIAKLASIGCAFLCGLFAGGGSRTPGRLIDASVLMTTGWAAWALVLFVSNGSVGRLGAPLFSPNTAATLLGVGFILALGQFLRLGDSGLLRRSNLLRVGWLSSTLILAGAALFLTQSRAGIFAVLAGSLCLVAFWPQSQERSRNPRRLIVLGGLGLLLLVLLEAGQGVLQRLPGLAEAAADRREIFSIYWQAFRDAPLFGSGLGTGTYVTKLGLTGGNYEALWNIQSAHNLALQWLAEGGLMLTLPMTLTLVAVLAGILRGLNALTAKVLLPLLFANFIVLVHGLSDFALQIPAFAFYWSFLLGLQTAVSQRDPSNRTKIHAGRSAELNL